MLNESNPRAVKKFQQDREYFQIGVSIDCVILGYEKGKLKVLLIECKLKEYEGMWSLLGDILRPEEDIDEASYRILRDRTGLDDVFLEQVQTFGSVNRHPGGRVITVAYYSLINIQDHKMKAPNIELNWYLVDNITEMAFDHKQILSVAIERLRSKVRYQPIGFELLDKKFPFSDLEKLYMALLDRDINRRNFSKKILSFGFLEETGELSKSEGKGRPSKMYQFPGYLHAAGCREIR